MLLKEEAKGKDHRSVATALVKLAACETEHTRKVKCLTQLCHCTSGTMGRIVSKSRRCSVI